MTENEYLQHIASATGLQHYPNQGPWSRKSGSVIGVRDGYVLTIGFNTVRNTTMLVILVRFKKVADVAALKTSLQQSAAFETKKPGKLGEVGSDFLRWEWKYSLAKPNVEEVASLAQSLCEALKPLAPGFDGRCEHCSSSSTPALTLINGVPSYICAGCQQKIHQELDQAAMSYEAIEPNYPNGLVLGVGAALLGGIAWGVVAYAINRIFLYGAILIGYFVAAGVIKGTKKVTRFGQVLVPILTVASVLFGDAIFYTLEIMKSEKVAFSTLLLKAVVSHLWELESEGSGILSFVFALVGAGYALYAARKPKFKAMFEPLGAPTSR
ncbi:MAG TPA: hypothetical protein VE263_11820 [Candidatus Angelobacter sp.]|nr:hypothetical protein [Candidatus Angelobacter sp.]